MYSEHQPVIAPDVVNYIGEEVAAVAATDLATAEDALELIDVEYEPLEPVFQTAARAESATRRGCTNMRPGNIGPTHEQDFGDPDAAFAACDLVVEDEFRTPVQHNTLAELHVALADFSNPDKLHMYTPTQGAPMYKMQMARRSGCRREPGAHRLRERRRRIHRPRACAKPHHLIAALLSRQAGRPVKIKATGDEEFIMFRGSGETLYRFRTGVMNGTARCARSRPTSRSTRARTTSSR